MAAAEDVQDIVVRLADIGDEIDRLQKQCEPIQNRLRELRAEQAQLKTRLHPKMVQCETRQVVCDNMKVRRVVQQRQPPLRPVTIEEALGVFFRQNNIQIDAKTVVAFIAKYRKENKIQFDGISIRRSNPDGSSSSSRGRGQGGGTGLSVNHGGAEVAIIRGSRSSVPDSIAAPVEAEPMVQPFAF